MDGVLLVISAGKTRREYARAAVQRLEQINARLVGESAAAVVMDVRSGDVLAIASSPSFDPNLFVRGISVEDYKALTENDHRPLANKSVQGTYPPASTYKIITAAAGLEVLSPVVRRDGPRVDRRRCNPTHTLGICDLWGRRRRTDY